MTGVEDGYFDDQQSVKLANGWTHTPFVGLRSPSAGMTHRIKLLEKVVDAARAQVDMLASSAELVAAIGDLDMFERHMVDDVAPLERNVTPWPELLANGLEPMTSGKHARGWSSWLTRMAHRA